MNLIIKFLEFLLSILKKEVPPEEPPPEGPESPPEATEPSGVERLSPLGVIDQSDLVAYADRVVIKEPGLTLLKNIKGSNSMDPVMDRGHTLIVRKEGFHDELAPGEIVVYYLYGRYIVHRIIEITTDDQGRLYKLEGDNNNSPDPYLVRDGHIKYLVVGIAYTKEEGG